MAQSQFSQTDNSSDDAQVCRIAIRCPPFSKVRSKTWFVSLDAQFFINGITNELTKYYFVVANLDLDTLSELDDIVSQPPAVLPYTTLKNATISRFSASYEENIRRLLETEQIGDRKPSSFLRALRALADSSVSEKLLHFIWSSRLPQQLQLLLAAQGEQDLSRLADIADRLAEILAQPQVSAASPLTSFSPLSNRSSVKHLEDKLVYLTQQIADLSRTVAAMSTGPSELHINRISKPGRQCNRPRSKFKSTKEPPYPFTVVPLSHITDRHLGSRTRNTDYPDNSSLCWYHGRYGTKAHKCTAPCTWSSDQGN